MRKDFARQEIAGLCLRDCFRRKCACPTALRRDVEENLLASVV